MEDQAKEAQPRLPPPQGMVAGYPTEEKNKQPTPATMQLPPPVYQSRETRKKKKSASGDFWKGCMAALCCCFLFDECCCCDITDLFVGA